jgi:hypothetical protein
MTEPDEEDGDEEPYDWRVDWPELSDQHDWVWLAVFGALSVILAMVTLVLVFRAALWDF